jgi:sugar phosphate isomerase/epimerase
MHIPAKWARFGDLLCIENMDKRKPIGQTVTDLADIFEALPRASLCFDIGHARQVDPTTSEAAAILQRYGTRLRQLHVSEVNSKSKHDPLAFESILAFRRVSHLVPDQVPVILESRVDQDGIDDEIENARRALSLEDVLALTGD